MEQQYSSKMEKPTRKRPRHRPLETCGSVIVATSRVVYSRIKTMKNPASTRVQRIIEAVIFFASLTTSPFHRHLIAILSVVDDHIIALQDTVETYFPSSTFAFLKMSELLMMAKNFPEKLDGFLEKFPGSMNIVAWLDIVLIYAIYWLDSLVDMLDRWRDKSKGTNEKEIMVDRSFSRNGSISISEEETQFESEGKKATYKEALQRGSSGGESISRDDPILELFENGWIQNPIKRSSRSADSLAFSPSDSYSTTT